MLSLRRALPIIILLLAIPIVAQTTSTITGTVTLGGNPLPGATVTITSPQMQGFRVMTTDVSGSYIFGAIPPGDYKVQFTMESLQNVTRSVHVGLSAVTRVDADMKMSAVSETVTVTAQAPLIENTSAATKTNFDQHEIETLPTGRNYTSVVQVTPGVSTDTSNNNASQSTITVYGSSGAENSYFIDGVNTTGVEYGFQGKELNFEFIREIDVKTGGYEAEFGRSTSGFVNVVTKSGTNSMDGTGHVVLKNDSLSSSPKGGAATDYAFKQTQVGFTFGGPIKRDSLFYFGSLDVQSANSTKQTDPTRIEQRVVAALAAFGSPDENGAIRRTNDARAFLAKLDWNASAKRRHSLQSPKNAAASHASSTT